MSASTTTDNKSEIECDDDENKKNRAVIIPFRDPPEECARFVRLVDKVSVKSFSCRLFINKLKTDKGKKKKKTKKKILMPKFWKTTHQRRRQNLRIFRLYGRIHTLILTILSSMDAFAQYVTRSC